MSHSRNQSAAFRYELKYAVTSAQAELLKNRISPLMPLDSHANPKDGYTVRSLYFDDDQNTCLHEVENGTEPREKFRIRIYNGSVQHIMLECKRKEHGKIQKTICPLTLEQTALLMQGKILPDIAGQPPLLRKLTMLMLTRRMRPVVIVQYERLPYVYPVGNVRVTLDRNIASSKAVERFLEKNIPTRPVMPSGMQLLEVKYAECLPGFLRRSLQLDSLTQTAFSKYGLCRKLTR